MNGRICGFCVISFKCSINQFLEYCDLAKVTAARLLTKFNFVLQRISKRKFLIIFCFTEVLFPRHSESNRTHILLEQAVQSLQPFKFPFRNIQKKFSEGKCSSPKSRQYFRKKMSVMKSVLFSVVLWASHASLVSVALLGRFCCVNEATQLEADKQKKENDFICSISL